MTRGFGVPQSLTVLASATNSDDRLRALKQLKNDIIGHESRKEVIIHNGVAKILAQCLTDDDGQILLQAIHVVTSLSNAGNAYIAPLVNADIVTALCYIFEDSNSPPKTKLVALRALAVIVQSLAKDPFEYYTTLRNDVYSEVTSPSIVQVFANYLAGNTTSAQDVDFFSLVLEIVTHTASDNEARQRTYVQYGVLDILASKLAAWIVTYQEDFRKDFPYHVLERLSAPPPRDCLTNLLLTIAPLVEESQYRSLRFLFSRDINAILPTSTSLLGTDQDSMNLDTPQLSHPWERLLPQLTALPAPVPNHTHKSDNFRKSFPVLNSFNQSAPRVPFVSVGNSWSRYPNEPSSHLLAWLVYMARSTQGNERLAVLWLLSVLVKATELSVGFGKPLGLLVVPIILRLITDEPSAPAHEKNTTGITPELILAEFINNSNSLQMAAFEGEAIKPLTSRLRKAFDVIRSQPTTMWSPEQSPKTTPSRSLTSSTQLGPLTPTRLISDTLLFRAHAIEALASISEKENTNRTDTIKTGIMSSVIDALNPYPIDPNASDPDFRYVKRIDDIDPKQGNPTYVLKAALALLLALSRSTNVLRTSLIDNQIAKPVLALVQHEDISVKLAATDVLINLLLHFSPMKEVITIFRIRLLMPY
jgi:hypothetical protein